MGRAHEVRKVAMAKTALAKSKKYSKWGKEILEAAKSGTPDPEMNQPLKKLIEKAKKDQCPADVIKRAIQKAEGITSGSMSETVYEGFGSGQVSVIVECLTDNVNRTFTDVRSSFTKTGGKLGVSGSVSHMFSRKAKFVFEGLTEDEVLELLMEADCDAEDISTDEDGFVTIIADPKDNNSISEALHNCGKELEFEEQGISLIPATTVSLDKETEDKFQRMLNMLSELDDVQDVHHNAILSEEE